MLMKMGMNQGSPSPCTDGGRRTTEARTPRSATASAAGSDSRGWAGFSGPDLLGGDDAGRGNRQPGGDDKRLPRPGQGLAEGGDDPPVERGGGGRVAGRGEVVDVAGVDHAVGFGCRLPAARRCPPGIPGRPRPRPPSPAAALLSDRARPITWCPALSSSRTTTDPIEPVAPVTNTRMMEVLRSCPGLDGVPDWHLAGTSTMRSADCPASKTRSGMRDTDQASPQFSDQRMGVPQHKSGRARHGPDN